MATEPPHYAGPMLDADALSLRLQEHVARTRRHGGFLSIAALSIHGSGDADALTEAALRVRRHIRTHDVVGRKTSAELVLVLPDTDMKQAARAAERVISEALRPLGLSAAAGVATGFGEVDGGGERLIDAAAAALILAAPGTVKCSDAIPGPRVLVVDDDPAFAASLAETITELGWDGEPCSDPAVALQRVRQGSYYGLFVDLILPGSSGVTILREFMAASKRPAILMSGSDAGQAAVLEALSMGLVMFLGKPPSRHDVESGLGMFRLLLPGARR